MHSAPGVWTSLQTGCPIRILTAHRLHAAPRERFAGLRVLLRPDAPRHPPWTRARLCLLGWGRLLPSRSSTLTWARDTRSPLFLFFLTRIYYSFALRTPNSWACPRQNRSKYSFFGCSVCVFSYARILCHTSVGLSIGFRGIFRQKNKFGKIHFLKTLPPDGTGSKRQRHSAYSGAARKSVRRVECVDTGKSSKNEWKALT
jgi:hypothetical protein